MSVEMNPISLKDIFKFDDLNNVKVRFNLSIGEGGNALGVFSRGEMEKLMEGQYWNYEKKKSYRNGQKTIGFARFKDNDLWLLFHVGQVTKDLELMNAIGYEYEALPEYEKYIGRMVVRFKNQSQNLVRKATSVMDSCEVVQILPRVYDNDHFPGYDQVNITWQELNSFVKKEGWKVALQNQKGVYLLTDESNGKMYVGSAYGDQMMLGRWQQYLNNGHGGNVGLKELGMEHIKKYFRYSILDIFKSTVSDEQILSRESWWKQVLHTNKFGYNRN